MGYIVTIYSDRMYNLESNIKDVIDKTSYSFNRARLSSYNLVFLKECEPLSYALKYSNKSIYNIVKDKYDKEKVKQMLTVIEKRRRSIIATNPR